MACTSVVAFPFLPTKENMKVCMFTLKKKILWTIVTLDASLVVTSASSQLITQDTVINMRNISFNSEGEDFDIEDRKYKWGETGKAEMCNLLRGVLDPRPMEDAVEKMEAEISFTTMSAAMDVGKPMSFKLLHRVRDCASNLKCIVVRLYIGKTKIINPQFKTTNKHMNPRIDFAGMDRNSQFSL